MNSGGFIFICYNKTVMAKSRRSYPKSPNRKFKIDFWPPNLTIYEKDTEYEGKPFKIKMDVKPQKPNGPTIELKERKEHD